ATAGDRGVATATRAAAARAAAAAARATAGTTVAASSVELRVGHASRLAGRSHRRVAAGRAAIPTRGARVAGAGHRALRGEVVGRVRRSESGRMCGRGRARDMALLAMNARGRDRTRLQIVRPIAPGLGPSYSSWLSPPRPL